MEKTMTDFGAGKTSDAVILVARILLVVLLLIFGWEKLDNYSATVGYMTQTGTPMPPISALVAIVIEFFLSIAVVLGVWTRPLAIVLALYALATAFAAHHYWTMTGVEQYENEINFYKNVSIMGGFFLLYVTGAGKYSIDVLMSRSAGARSPLA
jgi:putative oxidoreductase